MVRLAWTDRRAARSSPKWRRFQIHAPKTARARAPRRDATNTADSRSPSSMAIGTTHSSVGAE